MANPAGPKDWKFPNDFQIDDAVVEAADGSNVLAKLLVKRGLRTPAEVRSYLDPSAYEQTGPWELPDMKRAVARLEKAIANKEKITVYGDYDVDGVTSTSVMLTTLKEMGAEVDYYIPTRSEGYGLNLKAVSVLASKHRCKLIITCDCGISNFSEINFARSLGVDTIVVDHHTMPELMPPAAAILHPKQLAEDHPLFHLPGVGVAYEFCRALWEEKGQPERADELLDLVTLGMIADMVPLTKECRYLVQIGMPKLVASKRPGLKALLAQVGQRDGGTELVGFGLAPRINAVGRLSDANLAVKLMVTNDEAEAEELARQLEYENVRRQELCEEIFVKADLAVRSSMKEGDRAIAIFDTGWHHGVIGIVASRLVEKYHCPVFIGEHIEEDGIVKGSARGIEAIDLFQVLKANEHLAQKWGGHKMAAGFSVEFSKAQLFMRSLVDTCNQMLAQVSMRPVLDIDIEADPSSVTPSMAQILSKMAPFGIGNRKPIVVMRNVQGAGSRALGKEGKHSRISILAESDQFECVYWNSQGRVPESEQVVDVAFFPEMNHFNGTSRLQLVLSDWRDPRQPVAPVAAPPAVQSVSSVPGGKERANPPANPPKDSPSLSPSVNEAKPAAQVAPAQSVSAQSNIVWKDLRGHSTPQSLVEAAMRKLGNGLTIFAEGAMPEDGVKFIDRASLQPSAHLLIWRYPPDLSVLKSLLKKTAATNVYLVGGSKETPEEAASFLKRLLGLVRFAVNQREGQAHPEKLAAALSSTKMTVALGLTILKKINLIDWFAEEGCLYLDYLGQATEKPESTAEYRQLVNCLREVTEFRTWCDTASISDIQLAVAPVHTDKPQSMQPTDAPESDTSGIYSHDTADQLSSNFSREG